MKRIFAQMSTMMFGLWLGHAGERHGWSSFSWPWYYHLVALVGLATMFAAIRAEDKQRAGDARRWPPY